MAQQIINVGTSNNSGDGDPNRTCWIKGNNNFTELYGNVSAIETDLDILSDEVSDITDGLDDNSALLTSLKGEKGWGFYIDSLATPSITIGTSWTQITIDALGANETDSLPLDIRGISDLWTSNKITPVADKDDYDGKLIVNVASKTGAPSYIEIIIDFADSTPDTVRAYTGYFQTAKTPPFQQSLNLDFFIGGDFKANGGVIYARTDAGSYNITNRSIKLTRKSKRYV